MQNTSKHFFATYIESSAVIVGEVSGVVGGVASFLVADRGENRPAIGTDHLNGIRLTHGVTDSALW